MREVKINAVMNGFIVNVGCQTLVYQDKLTLLLELRNYLENPEQVEKQYIEKYGLKGEVPFKVNRNG